MGEVLPQCNAQEVVTRVGDEVRALAASSYGPNVTIPLISLSGHTDAKFPYILSHLEYIIGELLRNSIQACVENGQLQQSQDPSDSGKSEDPPAIEVTVCEAPQHVIIRVSDRGGGIPPSILPSLWSFSKGPRSSQRLENLGRVPKMAATMQELRTSISATPDSSEVVSSNEMPSRSETLHGSDASSSLSTLSSRPPNLRLGMGLPLSRVYAEYWAGNLELHSLEGYGVDAFLQISRLGNKNEQLTMRASMDAI